MRLSYAGAAAGCVNVMIDYGCLVILLRRSEECHLLRHIYVGAFILVP